MPERLVAPTRTQKARFSFRTRLDGVLYRFRFSWSVRGEFWGLDIYDSDGDPIVVGVACRAGENVLRDFSDPRLPPGRLVVDDTRGADTDPGRNDLEGPVRLVYVTAAEVAG